MIVSKTFDASGGMVTGQYLLDQAFYRLVQFLTVLIHQGNMFYLLLQLNVVIKRLKLVSRYFCVSYWNDSR